MMKTTIPVVRLKMVREKSVPYGTGTAIADPLDCIRYLKPLFEGEYREKVIVLGLDSSNHVTVIHVVGLGGVGSCPADVGCVLKAMLVSNSAAGILAHNHPSGNLVVSEADWMVTERVRKGMAAVGLQLLDHVIVDGECRDSLSMRGLGRWA